MPKKREEVNYTFSSTEKRKTTEREEKVIKKNAN